jgi:ferredoxin
MKNITALFCTIAVHTCSSKAYFCNPVSDIQISIIDREGQTHSVAAPTDMNMNLMEVCRLHELPVKGECGGMAMCATCQVYIESNHELSEPSDYELAMLDQAFFVKNNSRLGCQIHIRSELDGLIVRLAPES